MNDRIAIITGGSRGLGKAAALHLAWKGADVIITYLNQSTSAQQTVEKILEKGRKAVAIQLDTGDIGGFKDFAQQVQAACRFKTTSSRDGD